MPNPGGLWSCPGCRKGNEMFRKRCICCGTKKPRLVLMKKR